MWWVKEKRAPLRSILLLGDHCIACAINQRAHDLMKQLLASDDDDDDGNRQLGQELEMLSRCREHTDFNRLRDERPELAESKAKRVMIEETKTGRYIFTVLPVETQGKDVL